MVSLKGRRVILESLVSEVDNCGKSRANTCIELEFDWGGTSVKV